MLHAVLPVTLLWLLQRRLRQLSRACSAEAIARVHASWWLLEALLLVMHWRQRLGPAIGLLLPVAVPPLVPLWAARARPPPPRMLLLLTLCRLPTKLPAAVPLWLRPVLPPPAVHGVWALVAPVLLLPLALLD